MNCPAASQYTFIEKNCFVWFGDQTIMKHANGWKYEYKSFKACDLKYYLFFERQGDVITSSSGNVEGHCQEQFSACKLYSDGIRISPLDDAVVCQFWRLPPCVSLIQPLICFQTVLSPKSCATEYISVLLILKNAGFTVRSLNIILSTIN